MLELFVSLEPLTELDVIKLDLLKLPVNLVELGFCEFFVSFETLREWEEAELDLFKLSVDLVKLDCVEPFDPSEPLREYEDVEPDLVKVPVDLVELVLVELFDPFEILREWLEVGFTDERLEDDLRDVELLLGSSEGWASTGLPFEGCGMFQPTPPGPTS